MDTPVSAPIPIRSRLLEAEAAQIQIQMIRGQLELLEALLLKIERIDHA